MTIQLDAQPAQPDAAIPQEQKMANPTYGVLLLSFSKHSHQSSFVPLYQKHPRTQILAICDEQDIDPELDATNRQWAQELKVPYIRGLDNALALEGIDIVSVGHEIERRADLAIRCAAAGKHLWIDKFIGANISQTDLVVQKVEAAGVKSIIPSYTYGDLVQQSLEVVSGGGLGGLLGVHVDIMFGKGLPGPLPEAKEFLPAGQWKFPDIKREMLTVGSYGIGLIQRTLGPIQRVYAQAGAHFFAAHAQRGADDFSTITMTDDQGRLATLCGGRIGVAAHPLGGPSQAYLVGGKGTARLEAKRPMVDSFIRRQIIDANYQPAPDDPMQWHSGPPGFGASVRGDVPGLARGLEDLVDALDNDRSPAYTVADDRQLLEIAFAAYQSVVEGTPVDLPLPRGNNR